jgi:hypothetical protein
MKNWYEAEIDTIHGPGRLSATVLVHGGEVRENRRFKHASDAKDAVENLWPGKPYKVIRCSVDGDEAEVDFDEPAGGIAPV